MSTWLSCLHVSGGRLRPGLFFQSGLVLLVICFAFQRSCVESWAGRNHKSVVWVTHVGPGCLPKFLRGLGMSSPGLRYFWYSVTPSLLLIIVLRPLGAQPLYFLCFLDIIWWWSMPIHVQSLFLWICIAQLSWLLSGILYSLPWVLLRLNLILLFPFRLNWDGNETLSGLYW